MLDSTELPRILISEQDYERLQNMADSASATSPEVADYLQRELSRAIIGPVPENASPRVRMGDNILFRDNVTGRERKVRLVYPADADAAQDKISVLTPIGAALIGLSEGQSIAWQTRSGQEHTLTILEVKE